MPHPRQHITDLAEICFQKGIETIVISPGSRNAPLIDAFYRRYGDACVSLVDERSAAFFALGVARYTCKPVALLCSSGSAALNYAPALAEAFYQQVSLVAITADRPSEWIDQQDNQTIRQNGIYGNYIKKTCQLPAQTASKDDLWFAHREINEAINAGIGPARGPVHINVPLREPLYTPLPPVSEKIRVIDVGMPQPGQALPYNMSDQWQSSEKILIIHGQDFPRSAPVESLNRLAEDQRLTVVAENISNVHGEKIIANPELLLAHNEAAPPGAPDLLIYSGGQVVSKRLKNYLRDADIKNCWRIGHDESIIDTFQQTTAVISSAPEHVYAALADLPGSDRNSDYSSGWLNASEMARDVRDSIVRDSPFSDLTAVNILTGQLPGGSVLELGNSSIIRYAQIFDQRPDIQYFSNRGVSGIDGCLSSAVGSAAASGRLTVCIIGDLSFIYDSNGLWNRALPPNLRIAVINDKGGGIFSLINETLQNLPHKKYIEAHHPAQIQKLAEAFGVRYSSAENGDELKEILPWFYQKSGTAALLEIKTSPETNTRAFHHVMGKAAHR